MRHPPGGNIAGLLYGVAGAVMETTMVHRWVDNELVAAQEDDPGELVRRYGPTFSTCENYCSCATSTGLVVRDRPAVQVKKTAAVLL